MLRFLIHDLALILAFGVVALTFIAAWIVQNPIVIPDIDVGRLWSSAAAEVMALTVDQVEVRTRLQQPEPNVIVVWTGVPGDLACTKPEIRPSTFRFIEADQDPRANGVSAFLGGVPADTTQPCALPFAVQVVGPPVPGVAYPIIGIGGAGCSATFTPLNNDGHFSLWCGPPGLDRKALTKSTFTAYGRTVKEFGGVRPAAEVWLR